MQNKYLLPTASKPLIYLCFLKSYNYTPTRKKHLLSQVLFSLYHLLCKGKLRF